MSIWPFFLGRFVELPYTLVQDSTLGLVLGETTPRLWLEKVEFIRQYHGMALLNTHPDYLRLERLRKIYREFLQTLKERGGYWHSLPREAAQWWRRRSSPYPGDVDCQVSSGVILLDRDHLQIIGESP